MATDAGLTTPVAPIALPAVAIPLSQPLPRLSLDFAGTQLTPDEFDAIDDYDPNYNYELVNGVLVVFPIPSEGEVGPNEYLGHLLWTYKGNHPAGNALDVTLSERYVRTLTSTRRPDRVIWSGFGRPINPKTDLPTIVIEFVSKSRRDWYRDFVEKRTEYLAIGIKEYWVLDRFRRTMFVFKASGEPKDLVINETETYRTECLPGFELSLAQILAVTDKWFVDGSNQS